MPGGVRRTHEFPHGKPLLLILIDMAFAMLLVLALGVSVMISGTNGWRIFTPAIAIWIAYAVTRSLLLTHYERTGEAVPIRRISVIVKFPDGFPKPMFAARLSFFVIVAIMLLFGLGPFKPDVARHGIIGSVLGLIVAAVTNLLLEEHYVKAGRATEVEYSRKSRT